MGFRTGLTIASRRVAGQDRADVIRLEDGVIIVVADGDGADAAEALIHHVRGAVARPEPFDGIAMLTAVDRVLAATRGGSETTGVVVSVTADVIRGASVGDSEAWLVSSAEVLDLTRHQRPGPLLGSGSARPTAFSAPNSGGTLIVASDGLFKYADRRTLLDIVSGPELSAVLGELVAHLRLSSGVLQDDVAIVLCRSAAHL